MNVSNCLTITNLYNTGFIEEWIGKQITLYKQENIQLGKDFVPGIRIRDKIPAPPKTPQEIVSDMQECKTLQSLGDLWAGLDPAMKKIELVETAKESLKAELA